MTVSMAGDAEFEFESPDGLSRGKNETLSKSGRRKI